MAARKRFLLRLDHSVYDALEKWAADELRSVNGQMEYVLSEALKRAGRYKKAAAGYRQGEGSGEKADAD